MAKKIDNEQNSKQKQSFGDILEAFEKMEKEAKNQKKSTGQEWRYKKTEPVKKTLEAQEKALSEKKQAEKQAKEASREKIDPMTLWLRRYGVVDKDAEEEKLKEKMSQLDRGYLKTMAAEASIDLHGLTKDEAKVRLDGFIAECSRRKLTKIMIIHGKGNHSSTEPVLAKFVHDYIERHYQLGESGHPDRTEGGRGATWVILKHSI